MKNKFILILLLFVLFSCDKGEIPIPKPDSGNLQTQQVSMGEYYETQLYYSLEKNEIISTNSKTAWDLKFSPTTLPFHILLNSGNGMRVTTTNTPFETTLSFTGTDWKYDNQTGKIDSIAFESFNTELLYIIDRGYDEFGQSLGLYKFKFNYISADSISFLLGKIDATEGVTYHLTLKEFDFVYFSLPNGLVEIAPDYSSWDLNFTQYMHLFHEPFTPYVVSGVLLNPFETSATLINDIEFEQITFDDAANLNFYSNRNFIGYDWKFYDLDAGKYLVDPEMKFIIKNQNGYYYKLRFIDFYNESGIKGFPKFEVQQL